MRPMHLLCFFSGTCGEDGEIKIWSKSGMLRNKLQLNFPVYTFAWGASNESEQSQQFVYSQNKELVIASTKPSTAPVRWKAHEALILKVSVKFHQPLIFDF